jgi:uncharacterized protein (DUF58 family)
MLTRHGWTAVVFAAAAFVVGRLFGLVELYVLGTGLGLAVGMAVITVRRPLAPLQVTRTPRPTTVGVGGKARVDIEIRNAGRRRTPHLMLWEPVGRRGGAPMQLAALEPGAAAVAAYAVPTVRRGVIVTGPLSAERRDVLGMAVRARRLAGEAEVMIVPQIVPLPFPAVGGAGRLGQQLRIKAWGQTGSEFHALREYAEGDDPRRVSWKASARSTNLLVRETATESLQRCTVVLDVDAEQYAGEEFEHAVSAVASVVACAAEHNVTTRFVADGADVRGPEVVSGALRWMAAVEPGELRLEAIDVRGGPTDGLGLVVVVTGRADSAVVAHVRRGLTLEDTVVAVTTAGFAASGGFEVDGSSAATLVSSWTALVHGGRR